MQTNKYIIMIHLYKFDFNLGANLWVDKKNH